MSPMKEAKLYAGEALYNLLEAGKHLSIAGLGVVQPLAQRAIDGTTKAIEKAIASGKPEVAKALASASLSLGKVADSLNKASREMEKPDPKAPASGE
jgi:hypothetical protein